MSYGLIPQDGVVTVEDAGVYTGSASPTWTNLGSFTYRNLSMEDTVDKIEVSGGGDYTKLYRPGKSEFVISMELVIQNTGILGVTKGGMARFKFQVMTGVPASPYTWIGLVLKNKVDVGDGSSPQIQSIQIEGPVDLT